MPNPFRPEVIEIRETFVSVLSIVTGEATQVVSKVERIQVMLAHRYSDYEIVLVDIGMSSNEVEAIRIALRDIPCVRVIRLASNTTFDAAVFAGVESTIGDFVCTVDLEIDPIDEIPSIISAAVAGIEVVQGLSSIPVGGSLGSRIGRNLFYWYNRRSLGVDIPTRATYFTVLSRRAVNALTSTRRNQKYFRHLVRHIGLPIQNFTYEPLLRGRRARSVRTGVVDAVEMISSYSTHPLRLLTYVGIAASIINLAYAVYVVVVRLALGSVEEGWTSTSLQMSGMFFLLFLILAGMSEYMGRILNESRNEPAYFVLEEFESDVLLADVERRNVSDR